MTKRIISLLLAVLMIAASLTVFVSAAGETKTLAQILKAFEGRKDSVYFIIDETVTVDTDTIVPTNISIRLSEKARIIVTGAKLTVLGKLYAEASQISVIKGGSVTYSEDSVIGDTIYYYWTEYNPDYPWTFYPVGGTLCTKCGGNTVSWCADCKKYHCTKCDSHKVVINDTYCTTHKANKIQCPICGKYYCPTCEGGVHAYDTVNKKCVIIPYEKDEYKCSIHNIALNYCKNCGKYYCPKCAGGVHTLVNGKCVIYDEHDDELALTCPKHQTGYAFCKYCRKFYCPLCEGGYHEYNLYTGKCTIVKSVDSEYYCAKHNCDKVYCAHCNLYYCPECLGGYHIITGANTPCLIGNINNYNNFWGDYYYYEYVYIPGYGYVITGMICAAPVANIASGSVVTSGTQITLSTLTPGAKIYYTTDGTIPTVKSTLYKEPIKITANTTIRAIAVSNKLASSPVADFSYTVKTTSVKPQIPTGNIANFPGLQIVLEKLIKCGVSINIKTFDPAEAISWPFLKASFEAVGLKTDKITADFFADSTHITYEELIVASYRIFYANKLITNKKITVDVLVYFKFKVEITNTAITKAAFKSLYASDALYNLDFHPQDAATKAYFAYILDKFC